MVTTIIDWVASRICSDSHYDHHHRGVHFDHNDHRSSAGPADPERKVLALNPETGATQIFHDRTSDDKCTCKQGYETLLLDYSLKKEDEDKIRCPFN